MVHVCLASLGVTWSLKSAPYTQDMLASLKKKKSETPKAGKPISKQRAKMLALKPVIDGLVGDSSDESDTTDSEPEVTVAAQRPARETQHPQKSQPRQNNLEQSQQNSMQRFQEQVPKIKILSKNKPRQQPLATTSTPSSSSKPTPLVVGTSKKVVVALAANTASKSSTEKTKQADKMPNKEAKKHSKKAETKPPRAAEAVPSTSEPALPPLPKAMTVREMKNQDDVLDLWNSLQSKAVAPSSASPLLTAPTSSHTPTQTPHEIATRSSADDAAKKAANRKLRRKLRIEQAKSSNPPSSSGLALAKPIIEARGRQSGVPIRRNNFGVYASQYGGDGAPGPQNMGGGLLPPSAYSQPHAQMPFHHMPMQQQQAILHQQQVMQQQQAMLFNQQQAAMQAQQSPAGQPTMNPKSLPFFLLLKRLTRENHMSLQMVSPAK